ncbi:MAG TPA: MaoC family dehydratase [Stellaceae bacterium]|nr:MaoC family dehydratase [Stellaceae bacterium]
MSGFFGYVQLRPGRYRERFGLAFEEFAPGQVFAHRPGVDFAQQDNAEEALDTLNNAQLHYDSRYAAASEWRRPLGVSTLTLQRLLGMTSRTFYRRRRFLGFDEIAMTRPVYGGDTLYARTRVAAVEEGDAETGRVSLATEGLNQRGEILARLRYRAEIYRSGRHPEDAGQGAVAEEERFRLYHEGEDGALVEQSGLAFEEFVEGETFEHWPGKAISAAESRRHALRSLELNPRYADPLYARAVLGRPPDLFEPFVLGAVTALTTRTFGRVAANLGWKDVVLPRPVEPDETIRAVSTILAKRESASRPREGILSVDTIALGADDAPVCRFQRTLLVYKRGLGPYDDAGY